MKKFSDFNITVQAANFIGDKMKISKILNRPIIVHAFKIEDSKIFKNKLLTIQIEYNNERYVCFSGSLKLTEQIQQVPAEGFPFQATIEKEMDMYLFR